MEEICVVQKCKKKKHLSPNICFFNIYPLYLLNLLWPRCFCSLILNTWTIHHNNTPLCMLSVSMQLYEQMSGNKCDKTNKITININSKTWVNTSWPWNRKNIHECTAKKDFKTAPVCDWSTFQAVIFDKQNEIKLNKLFTVMNTHLKQGSRLWFVV